MSAKNIEVRKLLNEMTKEELVDCIISNNAYFCISKDGGISTARHYLITALLNRLEKKNKIDTGDITKAKNRKEIIDIIEADRKKRKKWEDINKRIEQLMKSK
ncbi:hypothetical protein B0H39_003824 [Clostridium beijerinckii]|uniref:hypothetical protein n=1 Tax=Clostridium beijerinckii TaxID=1520 RepID=UPI001494A807|nr:hypothetical protein [Clostridium beijerinckii]NOW85943.1 hypothetical protein [Clostridium beijerinckii]